MAKNTVFPVTFLESSILGSNKSGSPHVDALWRQCQYEVISASYLSPLKKQKFKRPTNDKAEAYPHLERLNPIWKVGARGKNL